MANRILRDQMRGPRKKAKLQAVKDQALLAKSSLNIQLLPEAESDAQTASLLRLNSSTSSEEKAISLRNDIANDSIFNSTSPKKSQRQSIAAAIQRKKEAEVDAALFPETPMTSSSIGVVVKKNEAEKKSLSLVSNDYASDSEDSEPDDEDNKDNDE